MRRLPNEHLKAFSRHLDLVLSKRPLLDVRASGEFAKGHMPHSCNLPILTDEERHQVGKTYKHEGAERAIQLGHALVSGDVKDARVAGWLEFVETHEQAMVMCWRGGQRSAIAQSWIAQAGRDVDRVPGGFKALRQLALLLLQSAEHDTREWLVVGGRTGTQ